MFFVCDFSSRSPVPPAACPLCGFLPIVYESSDRECFLCECMGSEPSPHQFRVSADDEEMVVESWNKIFANFAPPSAPCASDPRLENDSCDHREQ